MCKRSGLEEQGEQYSCVDLPQRHCLFFPYSNNISPLSRWGLCCVSQLHFVQSFCRSHSDNLCWSHDLTQYVWIALGCLLQMLLFGDFWGERLESWQW